MHVHQQGKKQNNSMKNPLSANIHSACELSSAHVHQFVAGLLGFSHLDSMLESVSLAGMQVRRDCHDGVMVLQIVVMSGVSCRALFSTVLLFFFFLGAPSTLDPVEAGLGIKRTPLLSRLQRAECTRLA